MTTYTVCCRNCGNRFKQSVGTKLKLFCSVACRVAMFRLVRQTCERINGEASSSASSDSSSDTLSGARIGNEPAQGGER